MVNRHKKTAIIKISLPVTGYLDRMNINFCLAISLRHYPTTSAALHGLFSVRVQSQSLQATKCWLSLAGDDARQSQSQSHFWNFHHFLTTLAAKHLSYF